MKRLVPFALAILAVLPAGAQESGLVIERVRLPRAPAVRAGDQHVTIVRADPRRYSLTVVTSVRAGRPRTLDAWVREEGLIGAVNAGMFLPNRRPVATLVHDDDVISDRSPSSYDGVVGWGPRARGAPEIAVGGRGCPHDLAAMRGRYRSVVQGFRMMIDCQGRPMPWTQTRRYSSVALGVDREGRALFVHTRTPYRIHDLNRMLAEMDLGIRGLVYMEGGPEASLVVRDGPRELTAIGSWEDGFNENDDNREMWDIPSAIGLLQRAR
jgi:uncharacterized protein YigE (DUF2233 family)